MRIIQFLFFIVLALIAFQNCSGSGVFESEDTSSVKTLTLNSPIVSLRFSETQAFDLESDAFALVNFTTGTVSFEEGTACELPENIGNQFMQLFDESSICEPIIEKGAISCMAISLPDIELIHADGESVLLARPICASGRWLCDGKDEQLRGLLKDLISSKDTLICD